MLGGGVTARRGATCCTARPRAARSPRPGGRHGLPGSDRARSTRSSPSGTRSIEALTLHGEGSRSAKPASARSAARSGRHPVAAERLRAYPHELSGGMRQRVMIALAISGRPRLLLADEPTTALDVTIQDQILVLLREIRDETGMSIVLVSHDMGRDRRRRCDRVAVMYAGRIVEVGPVADLFARPEHPYTQALLARHAADRRRRDPRRAAGDPRPASGRPRAARGMSLRAALRPRARGLRRRSRWSSSTSRLGHVTACPFVRSGGGSAPSEVGHGVRAVSAAAPDRARAIEVVPGAAFRGRPLGPRMPAQRLVAVDRRVARARPARGARHRGGVG